MGDHADRNVAHDGLVRGLVLERLAESTRPERGKDALRNAAGKIDAALRLENQRQIACQPPEIGYEQMQGLFRLCIAAVEPGGGDVGGGFQRRRHLVGGAYGQIEIAQSAPAKNLFASDAAFDALDMREDLIVAFAARADVDMTTFA